MTATRAVICPSVTPESPDPHLYREQIERIPFASRIQIDLMDGVFAPHKNINPIQIWWPDHQLADVHLMYQKPAEHLETLISLMPHMVILHIESDGDIESMLMHIKRFNINVGVALLADTPVEQAAGCIAIADHVMLFAGKLGSFGGVADMTVLNKISKIRRIRQDIEIGWDGGINDTNIAEFVEAGITVCNVGGFIQRSVNPQASYDALVRLVA